MADFNPYEDIVKDQVDTENKVNESVPNYVPKDNDYENIINEDDDNSTTEVSASMIASANVNPDKHAELMALSKKTGLPTGFIERNYDLVKKKEIAEENDYASIVKDNPNVAAFIKDKDNSAIAKDDINNLKSIEEITKDKKPWYEKTYDALKYGSYNMAAGLAKTPAFVAGEVPYNPLAMQGHEGRMLKEEIAKDVGEVPRSFYDNKVTQYLDKKAEDYKPSALNRSIIGQIKEKNYKGAAETLALMTVSNFPQLASAYVTQGKSLITLGASVAGQTTAESLSEGVPTETAKVRGVLYGGIEVGTESLFGVGTSAYRQTVKQLVKETGEQGAKQIMKETGKHILKGAAEEGSEELVNEFADSSVDWALGTKDRPFEGIMLRMADSFMGGAGSGGLISATSFSFEKALEHKGSVVKNQKNIEAYDKINEAVQESKVKKRLPEKAFEFLDNTLKGSPIENVYIPQEAFNSYFQSKGQVPVEVAKDLGIVDNYNAATESNVDVKIPLKTMVEKLGETEHYQSLKNDIKFNPEDKTFNEIVRERDEARAEVEKAIEAAKNPSEDIKRKASQTQQIYQELVEIRSKVKSSLIEQGLSEKDATKNASILYNNVRVRSEQLGLSPNEYLAGHGFSIGGKFIVEPTNKNTSNTSNEYFQNLKFSDLQMQNKYEKPESVKITQAYLPTVKDSVLLHDINKGSQDVRNEHTGLKFRVKQDVITNVKTDMDKVLLGNLRPLMKNAVLLHEFSSSTRESHGGYVFYSPFNYNGNMYIARFVGKKRKGNLQEIDRFLIDKASKLAPLEGTASLETPSSGDTESSGAARDNISLHDLVKNIDEIRKTSEYFQTSNQNETNVSPIGFYSQLETEVSGMDFKSIPAKDLVSRIKNIQGIKKEELEFTGVLDYLAMKGSEKVSKEDILNYIKSNGLKVDQVILGEKKENFVGENSFGQEPDFSEEELGEIGSDLLYDLVNNDLTDYKYEAEKGRDDRFNELLDEAIKEAKLEDSNLSDEEAKDIVYERTMESYLQGLEEAQMEYYQSEDGRSAYAERTVTEKISGESMTAYGEDGEWSWEGKRYGYNLEEAKIKFANDLYEHDKLDMPIGKPYKEDINFEQGESVVEDTNYDEIVSKIKETQEYKDKEIEFKKEVKESPKNYPRLNTDSELKRRLENKLDKYISSEVDKYISPNDSFVEFVYDVKNEAIESYSSYFEMQLKGNNVNGWGIDYRYIDKEGDSYRESVDPIKGQSLDQAKEKALSILSNIGYLNVPNTEANNTENIYDKQNSPTGKYRWKQYSVFGKQIGSNYREVLLTLNGLKGNDFTYTTHFNEKNFVAHARVSDITVNGKKTLFIEEIQSDWHQQGREHGYASKETENKISELEDKSTELKGKIDKIDDQLYDLKDNINTTEDQIKYDSLKSEQESLQVKYEEVRSEYKSYRKQVPDAPLKQTDAWAALVMKRMIRLASEGNYDAISWTPGSVHVDRWGTDFVSWVKKTENGKDYWLVGSAEQRGGNADNVNIEELARSRGELLEKSGEKVTNEEELAKVVAETLGREKTDRSLKSIVDRVWKQMQGADNITGSVAPRKEGMEFFYDKLIPDTTKKILSKIDKSIKIEKVDLGSSKIEGPAYSFDISQAVKDSSLNKGFSYFQEGKLGVTQIAGGYINVSLLDGANRSTFIHEMGHSFFEMLYRDSKLESAPQSIKDDFKTLLNYVGVDSYDKVTTEHHEKIARSFEQYLFEGKAPSDKLRKAFNTFKQWLIDVYKTVSDKQLFKDIKLTDDVREVFDRLLATDEEINSAKERINLKELFDDPSKIGMSEKDQLEYHEAMYWAKAEASEILTKKLLEDVTKKQTSAYNKRYKELLGEETKKASEITEFKVIDKIKDPDFRLSKPVINEYYSEFRNFLPGGTTKVNGGLHPDFVASMFGYENGQALLQALAPYRRGIKHYAETQVATRLKQEFPELLTSPSLSDEAIKAFHNESYKKLKKLELEFLAREYSKLDKKIGEKLIKRLPSDSAIKESANSILAKTNVSDLKPNKFRLAERKSALETAKYYKNSEYALAFESKKKEVLNSELYDISYEAKDNIDKSIRNFKKLFKKDEDLAKTRDMNLVNVARAVLSAYGLTNVEKTLGEYLEPIKQYDPDSYNAILPLVQSAVTGAKNYNDITYDKFIEVKDTVESLMSLASSNKEMEIDGKLVQKETIKGYMIEGLNKFDKPKISDSVKETITKWGKVKSMFSDARASMIRIEHLADAIDIEFGGPFRKYMWQPISDAAAKYRLEKNKVLTDYREILDGYKSRLTPNNILAKELNFNFKNKAELMMAVLHSGNNSNLQKLLVGRGWGEVLDDGSLDRSRWDTFINRMISEGTLNKQDFDFAQSIWDLNETLKPGAQKAHKKMYGHYFNEITFDKVVTPFGEYKGGYIPAKVDQFENVDAKTRAERQAFEENNNSWQYPTAGRGFTKTRIDTYAAPLSLDMNLLGSHIDGVLRFTHIEPRVKEVARLFLDKELRAEVSRIDSSLVGEAIIPWLQRTATQKVVLPSQDGLSKGMDAVARYLRSNVGANIMFGNVTNTLQQFTGLGVAMVKVNPKYIRNALFDYIKGPKGVTEEIMSKSDFMKSTQGQNIFEVYQSIDEIITNPSVYDNFKNFTKKHAYFLQSAAQNTVNTIVWTGAYNKSINEGMDELGAVRFADSAVRETQGSMNPEDISRFETGTPTQLLFKQFVGYFNMLANLNSFEMIKTAKSVGLKKGAGRAFYIYIMGMAIPAILSEAINVAMSGKLPDPDDEDEFLNDIMGIFFGSQIKTAVSTVPFGGQFMVASYNQFNNKQYDDRLSLSPAVATLETMTAVPADVYKAIKNDNVNSKKVVRDVLTSLGALTGVPVAPLAKPINYLTDVNTGKAEPTGPIDFGRGLVTGKSGK